MCDSDNGRLVAKGKEACGHPHRHIATISGDENGLEINSTVDQDGFQSCIDERDTKRFDQITGAQRKQFLPVVPQHMTKVVVDIGESKRLRIGIQTKNDDSV